MFDVAVVGSANLDIVVRADRLPRPGETLLGGDVAEHPGGKGLNQAVAAARCGAAVGFVGCVGDDDAGRFLIAAARGAGVHTTAVEYTEAAPTGRALITVDAAGENTIVVVAGANALVLAAALPPARVVLAQLEVPLATVAEAFRRSRDATRILNPAPACALAPALLAECDVLVPNEHELDALGGAVALLDGGVGTLVVTRGGAGVDVLQRRNGGSLDEWHLAPFPVSPVDTTGAGDAFCGALAAAIADGRALPHAVRFAAAAGALATETHGAVPSLPHRAAIDALVGPVS